MKKDLDSYIEHNKQFETILDLEWHREKYRECDELNYFENLGFKKVIDENPKVRKLHIDIGSGAGGLLLKTAPYFEMVVGIEPSKAAVKMARIFAKGIKNIEFINADAIDAIRSLNLSEPVFFTTSMVFTHIKNYYVIECLRLINNAPLGSVLFFMEPYDKNIQYRLWYIRRKKWWAENLSHWALSFCRYTGNGYKYGISGVFVGKENVANNYKTNVSEDILWLIDGFFHFLLYLPGRKIRLFAGKLLKITGLHREILK